MDALPSQVRGCPRPLTESSTPPRHFPCESLDYSDTIEYVGVKHLYEAVCRQYALLDNLETASQILKFRSVSEEAFNILAADATRPCKFIRLHYHTPSELLFVKIMPGWDHENLAFILREMIQEQIREMNIHKECLALTAPLNELGPWVKEPDLCWVQKSSWKPGFIVEIGTSESSSQLVTDAHGWFESHESPVQAVLTVDFQYLEAETDLKPMTISLWKPAPQLIGMNTNDNLCPAIRTSSVSVQNEEGRLSVSGFQLDGHSESSLPTDQIRIPFEVFVGRQAVNPGERDVVISKDRILTLLRQLWECRQQRQTAK